MKLSDVERMLAARGYVLVRCRGSHRHYRNFITRHRLTISYHGAHSLGWRRIEQIRRDIERDDQKAS